MKSIYKKINTVILVVSLSSCSTQVKFNEKQAAALTSTSIPAPVKESKAYSKPVHASASSQKTSNNMAFTIGFLTGPIGGLVGGAIIGGMQVADQKNFEKNQASYIAKLESNMNQSIEKDLQNSLKKYLGYNPFFAKRLKPVSPYPIQTTISNYGLIRVDASKEERYAAHVVFRANLVGANGQKLIQNQIVAGNSYTTAYLYEFAQNKKILDKAMKEASDAAASTFANNMKTATAKVQ